jgi:hypothetical protein
MKRFVFVLLIFVLFFGISSCAGSVTGQERSTFYATFSLGEIVARQEQFLLPEARSLSGTEAGPTAPPYQKHEEMIVQIDPANISRFIEAVKADTQQAILDSGARIEGQGGSFQEPTGGPTDYISFRYSQDEVGGIINLYGVDGEGTNYIIILIITEN